MSKPTLKIKDVKHDVFHVGVTLKKPYGSITKHVRVELEDFRKDNIEHFEFSRMDYWLQCYDDGGDNLHAVIFEGDESTRITFETPHASIPDRYKGVN